jgi:hypothetical protein
MATEYVMLFRNTKVNKCSISTVLVLQELAIIDIQLKYDCHESIFMPRGKFQIILIHRYIKLVSCSRLNG